MSQSTTDNSKAGVMLRAFAKDQERIDALIAKLEADRGGSWSRAHVIEIALDALEESEAGKAA